MTRDQRIRLKPLSREEDTTAIISQPGLFTRFKWKLFRLRPEKRRVSLRCKIISVIAAIFLLLVIASIALVIWAAINGGGSSQGNIHNLKVTFSLDDVFNDAYEPKYGRGTWVRGAGGNVYTTMSSDGITLHHCSDGVCIQSEVVPPDVIKEKGVIGYSVSPSLKYVLLYSSLNNKVQMCGSVTRVMRTVYIFDNVSGYPRQLKTGDSKGLFNSVYWSPSIPDTYVTMTNTEDVACDMFVFSNLSTNANSKNNKIRGLDEEDSYCVDRYYQDILHEEYPIWWSPDGNHILYLVVNFYRVTAHNLIVYGDKDEIYPTNKQLLSSKPGEQMFSLHTNIQSVQEEYPITINSRHILEKAPGYSGDKHNYFVQNAGWTNSTHFYLIWMNRQQNMRYFTLHDISKDPYNNYSIYSEKPSQEWIETVNVPKPVVLDDSKLLLVMTNGSGFMNLAVVDIERRETTFKTTGAMAVTDIAGYSRDGSDIIYQAASYSSGWKKHLYSYKYDNRCLTCNSNLFTLDRGPVEGVPAECGVFDAECSADLSYCAVHCRGPAVPFSVMMRYNNGTFTQVEVLEANKELISASQDLHLPTIVYHTIPADNESSSPELYGRVMLPPGFDPDREKSYPALVVVNGTPGSHSTSDVTVFDLKWAMFQSASLDCVIVYLDVRGTGCRGHEFMFSVYKQLGQLEVEDLVRATRYLSTVPSLNIDAQRIGIYGSVYGGYLSLMAGFNDSIFKVAIAQSPIVDFKYSNSMYIERFMGLPDDSKCYENTSVFDHMGISLSSLQLLLIHATDDEYIHFQNTAQLLKAFNDLDFSYNLVMYVDKPHDLDPKTTGNLYTRIDTFLKDNMN